MLATSCSNTAQTDGICQGVAIIRHAQQQVVAQRFAEEARYLRRVGTARRHEEMPGGQVGVRDEPAVPVHLACVKGQQAEERPH